MERLEDFHDAEGRCFDGLTIEKKSILFSQTEKLSGITKSKMIEAASFSLAMVIRYALGLNAKDGNLAVIVTDSLAGAVALAGARHLKNAGAVPTIYLLETPTSDSMLAEINIHSFLETEIITEGMVIHELESRIHTYHNILLGVYDGNEKQKDVSTLIELLNDASTPIHCVDGVPGIDPDSGAASKDKIFASSTLSLGAPYKGFKKAKEYVGRHYVCDLSIPKKLYKEVGHELNELFNSQPVVQIFPLEEKTEET